MTASHANQTSTSKGQVSLAELALVFLKLGTTAFGGPAAHIAMMEDEFVRKRQWITQAEFLDRLAAASLIPGPSSTEVAIFIGQSKRGWAGLLVGGVCFILPAGILVTLIAAVYARYGSLPQVAGILYGIKPAVIAIILQALWTLSRTAIKTKLHAVIGMIAVLLNAVGVAPLIVLAIAGIAACGAVRFKMQKSFMVSAPSFVQSGFLLGPAVAAMTIPVSLVRLFLSFLKIGAVVFGSGYVLLAFLRAEFIDHLHWITEKQLLDAIAVGQFTPGPVFTTATFIGYLVAGIPGAAVSTVGIFLPGFVLVASSGPLIPKLRQSALASAILDGVVAGSLALMAVVAWQLGRTAIVDWRTVIILSASAVLVLKFRVNSAWVIAGAALSGWFLH
ncbi:MAG TPA: chromate efflux transporter [Terriglobales bacterium]|nr:chromate efflux transporter [Terriglobales bacterium]